MNKFASVLIGTLAAVLMLFAWQPANCQDQPREAIRVKGSESAAWMVDAYAKEFMKNNPTANIVVAGGLGIGSQALLAKECDIAMASRKMTEKETEEAVKKGLDIQERMIGWGGIVIIAHPSNPVNELTVDQVRKLLAGEYTNWSQAGGPDKPVSVLTVGDERPGTLHFIQHDFLKASLAPNAINKNFFRAVISAVSDMDSATSFVRVRNILQLREKGQDSKIKVIAIKKDENSPAVLPSRKTVDDNSYPITRPYFLYLDAKTSGKLAKDFLDFCSSKNPRAR
jgi:phosphate transport system substrate-binding protein